MGLGLGPFELILIFGVLLLLFGAKRLPELASGMGKGIRGFKHALNGADDPAAAPDAHQVRSLAAAPPATPVPGTEPSAAAITVEDGSGTRRDPA